jgi:hypothetical protein
MFVVRATDAAGNVADATYGWTIDTVAPTASITQKPANVSNDKTPSFGFTGSELSTFTCKLDAAAFAACTSPTTYAALADGPHTFDVRATDAAGNTGVAASYAWTIDASAPSVTITQKPTDPSNNNSPTFGFTASENGSTFACRLDNGSFAPCASPAAYTSLADGSHTFAVRATDTLGNTGSPTSYSWTIDTVAPTASITQKPANPSTAKSPSFAFTVSGATQIQCRLDAAAFSACTSPIAYSNLADGTHTFTVRGTDAAGNAADASYAWTIDTVGPTATITQKPNNPSTTAAAGFAFTAGEAATFECKLDAAAAAACTSPVSYANLADGQHTFTVRAMDALGNPGAPVSYTWRIDTVAPTVTIGQKPSNPSPEKSPSFAFTASETGSTFACQLDAAAFAACTSPTSYAGVGDGQHTFTVRATDAAGNTGAPTSYTWTIDATGPTASITQKPSDPTNNKSAAFAFTASEQGSTFACRLDAAAFAACTSPTSYTGLADGTHTFGVRAIDALGNPGVAATYQWIVDTSPPTAAITQKPSSLSNTGSPSFAFSASESGSTFACRRDGGAFAACGSPTGYSGLVDGPHTFGVRATDPAGNMGPETSYAWTIDTAAPTATITDKPSGSSSSNSPSFSFTASESSSFSCRLDGGAFAPCGSPANYSGLGDGPHTFAVKATDAAGNTGPETSYSWTIETRPPTAALTSAPTALSNSSSATFTFSADEPSAFECKLDDRGYDPCGSPASYHGLSDGPHAFNVRPRDGVGNVGNPAAYSWRIDATPPETTVSSAPTSGATATSATFAFTANEPSAFECRLDGAAFALCGSPKAYGGLTTGEHRFEVRAIDAAGNVDATQALYVWTIKAATPTTPKTTSALLAPRSGARVTRPPLLVWRKVAGAGYYNVQVYRGKLKVFSGWPTKARLRLRARWSFLGRKRSLAAGRYRWYVWPGYGRPSARNYGSLLGQSTFTVVGGKQLKR